MVPVSVFIRAGPFVVGGPGHISALYVVELLGHELHYVNMRLKMLLNRDETPKFFLVILASWGGKNLLFLIIKSIMSVFIYIRSIFLEGDRLEPAGSESPAGEGNGLAG